MPMPPYQVLCYNRGCGKPAVFKIAADWSDGVTEELKTYALTCESCLAERFRLARTRRSTCRLVAGETLGPPRIYALQRGCRDRDLVRRMDIEERILGEGSERV